ncbi:MAG: replication initiator protein A [Eubacteriales bacterium]
MDLSYFYKKEPENYTFFKMPKFFFTEEGYRGLPNDAKLLYCLLLDRVSLSRSNGWEDNKGRIYILYTIAEGAKSLKTSERTAGKLFSKLEAVGLLERKKQGQGKPDLLYLKDFTTHLGETTEKKKPKKHQKTIVEKVEETTKDQKKLPTQSGNECTLRSEKISDQDMQGLHPNKIKRNKTEGLRPILPPNPQSNFALPDPQTEWVEGWTDLNTQDKIYQITEELELAYHKLNGNLLDLFYQYRTCESKLDTALYVLTQMEETDRLAKEQDHCTELQFYYRARKLYVSALSAMLTDHGLTKVKSGHVNYSKVIDKLVNHITIDEELGEIRFDTIVECTLSAYIEANKASEIISPFPYMKSCIWTTLCEGNIRHEAKFHRLYG